MCLIFPGMPWHFSGIWLGGRQVEAFAGQALGLASPAFRCGCAGDSVSLLFLFLSGTPSGVHLQLLFRCHGYQQLEKTGVFPTSAFCAEGAVVGRGPCLGTTCP